jgi:hypothetical protein
MAPAPEVAASTRAGFAALLAAISPWVSAETTINFAQPVTPEEFAAAWPPAILERLASVRGHWDPSGVFPYAPALGS